MSKNKDDPNSSDSVEVMYQDLKGYIPKMLLNMFIAKMCALGVSKFRNQALEI